MSDHTSMRLNKYISESGMCSRREADRYIERGSVFINGKKAKIGDQVFAGDKVMVNGNFIEPKEEENLIFIAFNKPVGITSTTETGVKDNIVDYVNHSERIFPIGRLDKDSQGLIFLTNNGDIVNKILRAGNKHEKEYLVTVDKPVTDQFLNEMSAGVPILGVNTKKCKVSRESTFVFKIILIQGLNRQIRRMCEHFDYQVIKLERTRIINVNLKGLPLGEWRELTEQERAGIFKAIEKSSADSNKKASADKAEFKEPQKNNNPDKRNRAGFVKSNVKPDKPSMRTGTNGASKKGKTTAKKSVKSSSFKNTNRSKGR